jgi:hypothetical protein
MAEKLKPAIAVIPSKNLFKELKTLSSIQVSTFLEE